MLRDTTSGDNYALTSTSTWIGRKADNDIVLNDPKVTGHHAAIVATPTGYLIAGHRNNVVQVDGVRISAPATLSDGAVIGIGGRELIFEIRDEANR